MNLAHILFKGFVYDAFFHVLKSYYPILGMFDIVAHVQTNAHIPAIRSIHLNATLTILFHILSGCSLNRKALGECMCQKVMQSAHHAETAQTSSVLWGLSVCLCVGVSE